MVAGAPFMRWLGHFARRQGLLLTHPNMDADKIQRRCGLIERRGKGASTPREKQKRPTIQLNQFITERGVIHRSLNIIPFITFEHQSQ
jgi:hypothetical protein